MTPRAADPPRRLFLLDGHSLSYRAFFALPPSLATTSGQVTNAVYGFTSMLIKLLAEERPDLIAVAFDVGRPTVRLDKYAEYKAGRPETPDEFRQQLGLIVEVLETLRIPVIGIEGHEADDAIATLALRALAQGIEVVIVTADRDFFQLVRPGLTVMFNVKGISDIRRYDVEAVTERFGLPPEKYLDYVALKGDASDNIPGVPGVGEKTATKLVQDFGSVEELMTRTDELKGKLKESISAAGEQLALNKELAELNTDVDVDLEPDDAVMGEWDLEAVRRLFTSLEFRTLFERLEEVGRSAEARRRGGRARPAAGSTWPRRSSSSRRTDRRRSASTWRGARCAGSRSRWAGGRRRTRRWAISGRSRRRWRTTRWPRGSTTPRTSRRPWWRRADRSRASGPTRCCRPTCSTRPARASSSSR